jgi:DNA-directed RNA polymerase
MKLEIARSFVNDTFYFPHNMDFRGRAYPVSPLFNHIGADSSRGLLIFARGKPLGKTGLYWLKIHLANVYGYDKASFEEREKFAMDHLEDISDSAVNPLNGRRWWLTAEDPWQCLATCKELRNALDSPDPTQFVSHLPVHQDGTCNGLQHYAALGGDVMGAQQVNLEPGSRPADIYSAVAQMVEDAAARDAAAGNELAAFLVGKIRRKVVKQTVMTSVYGVTRFGGHRQVSKQVDELIPVDERFSPSQLAKYINHQIFNSLSSMFLAAHHIQHWFIECANRICRAVSPEHLERIELSREGGDYRDVSTIAPSRPSAKMEAAHQLGFLEPVVWTTPLKLPVVQPYRTRSMYKIHTGLQHVSLHEHQSSAPVDRRKQMAAFPPNFVHSLDATHMYLTAIKCNEMGLTFASVHDSFWTHAADVDTMNGVVRDTFITVHQDAVLVRLAEEFRARYKDCLFLMTVPPSNKAAQSIREFRHKAMTEWRKASRAGANGLCKPRDRNQYQSYVVHELLLERQRQLLLQSDDVEERETGRQMVTPASLYEEANNASSSLSETAPEPTAVAEELHSSLSPPTSSDLADGIASLESNLLDTEVAEVDVEGDDAASAVWVSDKDFDPDDAAAKAEKKKGKKKKKKHQPASEIGEEEERQKEATGKATDKVQAKGSRKKANVNKPLKIWHPLFFPPVPPKVGVSSFFFLSLPSPSPYPLLPKYSLSAILPCSPTKSILLYDLLANFLLRFSSLSGRL